jgi:hypothetical protein
MVNSGGAAKILGGKYSYIIMNSDEANYERRCARTGPNGKPCILPDRSHSVTHLSRGFDKETFVAWYFLTDRDAPTSVETRNIHSTMYDPEELKKMGYGNYVD